MSFVSVLIGAGAFVLLFQEVSAQQDQLTTMCFRNRTIQVPYYLAQRYAANGATYGPCMSPPPPPPPDLPSTNEWTFDAADLSTSIGPGLMTYADSATPALTSFGTTDGSAVPHIAGEAATYMHVPAFTELTNGYLLTFTGSSSNGGGQFINQYTFIADVLVPGPLNWTPFFNANVANANDADFYIAPDGAVGAGGNYSTAGLISPDTWHRVAFVANMAAATLTYFVDGLQVGQFNAPGGRDGHGSLFSDENPGPDLLLFNEGDTSAVYTHELYVASIAFTDRNLSSSEIATLGGPAPSGIFVRTPRPLVYEWTFDGGDLSSSIGPGLMTYADAATPALTSFGTTDHATVPHIAGEAATYMHVPAFTELANGYLLTFTGSSSNGGGQFINQYTFIADVLVPAPLNWTPFFNANVVNGNDADFYIAPNGSVGIGGVYSMAGIISPNTWHRVAFVANLAAITLTYFVDGTQVGEFNVPDGRDGRWSLFSDANAGADLLLFNEGDASDVYTHELYVASIAFTDRNLSAAEIATLGGPTSDGIWPRRLKIRREGESSVLTWRGGAPASTVVVQASSDLVTWEDIATNNVGFLQLISFTDPVSEQHSHRFYRAAVWTPPAGTALHFDGVDDVVSVPHDPPLNAFPLTITAWLRTAQKSTDYRGLVSKYVPASGNGYSLHLYEGRLRAWYFKDGANFVYNGDPGFDGGFVANGKWHHIALVVDGAGGRIYIDGFQTGSLAWTGTAGATTSSTPLLLGRYFNYPVAVNGQLDEITFWNRALTENEIQSQMNHRLAGAENGLIGYWRFDDASGGMATDATGHGHDASLQNGPVWVDSTAPIFQ